MEPDDLIEAAREDHPEVVEELERLRYWVNVTLGSEVAAWQGPEV